MKVEITRSAEKGLLNGMEFYQKHGDDVGAYFLDTLFSDIDSLSLHGGVHRTIAGYHRALSSRFPYAIYYKVENNVVKVYHVLDCRRNPRWIRNSLKDKS